MKSHKLNFKKKNFLYTNVEATYDCNEAIILNGKLIKFYKKKLNKNIYLNKQVNDLSRYEKEYDFILDCTNATMLNKLNLILIMC